MDRRQTVFPCGERLRRFWRREQLGILGRGRYGEPASLGDAGDVHVQPLAGEESEGLLLLFIRLERRDIESAWSFSFFSPMGI